MRKLSIFKSILAALVALPLVYSCVQDKLYENPSGVPEGEPVTITLPFSASTFEKIEVGTKSHMSEDNEYRVYNVYVMLFDGSGNKFYGRLFNASDLVGTRELSSTFAECWCVNNRNGSGTSVGQVKISTISQSGCTVWIGSNVGLSGGNASGVSTVARLNEIQTFSELQELKMNMGEETLSRRGYLPMGATLSNINTGSIGEDTCVSLRRYDAKITVRVRSNPTNVASIKPVSWKVCNLPHDCYVIERPTSSKSAGSSVTWDSQDSYFDSSDVNFEGTETEVIEGETVTWNVFSFYMLENRLVRQKDIAEGAGNYYLREKQLKADDGKGGIDNGAWEYANVNSTYLTFGADMVLTEAGLRDMLDVAPEDPLTKIGLTTQCKYTIHLGDFTNCDQDKTHNYNDYNTFRNFSYTYNVVINNAKQIYVEVDKHGEAAEVEPQPSEIGRIVLAEKKIFNCDAHYENHIMSFDYLPSEDISHYSWYAVTPFSEGFPQRDMTVTDALKYEHSNLDDQWVQFKLNTVGSDGFYLETREPYPPLADQEEQLMDVAELLDFLYQEAKKWESEDLTVKHSSAFWDGSTDTPRPIVTTAFVNEYYYEVDPLTGERNPSLWRFFVDAPDRELHILSTSMRSKDKESSVIESHHSVVQRSIKTIYNANSPTLNSLWGVECIDEFADEQWICGDNGSNAANAYYNGRFNSERLWGLTDANANTWTTQSWDTYLNFRVPENTPQIQTAKQQIIYTCLARNRDNNGDGLITADEVRWYMPAIGQLNALWLGNDALPYDVRLYYGHEGELFHTISSNRVSSGQNMPTIEEGRLFELLWSEEGGSNSELGLSYKFGVSVHHPSEIWKHYSTRCVRNVGTFIQDGTITDISYYPVNNENQETDSFFTASVEGTGEDAVMTFSFDQLNPKALRFFTDVELVSADENSVQNRVYNIFETQPVRTAVPLPSSGILTENINDEITKTGVNKYCPEGYRLPNEREASIIALNHKTLIPYYPGPAYMEYNLSSRIPTRTFYSFGQFGSQASIAYETSTHSYKGYYLLEHDRDCLSKAGSMGESATLMRCVRDVDASATLQIGLLVSDGIQYSPVTTICPGSIVNVEATVNSPYSDIRQIVYGWRYTNKEGQVETKDAFTQTFSESKRQFTYDMNVAVPGSDDTEWDLWPHIDITKPVYLEAKALNMAGTSATATSTLAIKALSCSLAKSSAADVALDEPADFLLTAESFTNLNLQSLVIEYKKQDDAGWTVVGSTGAKVTGSYNPAFTPGASKKYNSGNAGTASLTFSESGKYKLRLTASDGYMSQSSPELDVEVTSGIIYFDNNGGPYYSQPAEFNVPASGFKVQLPAIDWANGDYFEVQMQTGTGGTQFILGNNNSFTSAPNYGGSYSVYMWSGSNKLALNNGTNYDLVTGVIYNRIVTLRFVDGKLLYKTGTDTEFSEVTATSSMLFNFQNSSLVNPLYFGARSDSNNNAHYYYAKIVRGGAEVPTGPIDISSLSLNRNTLSMLSGGSAQGLSATYGPYNASIQSVSWSSSDSSVATVTASPSNNYNASVTPVAAGSANITITVTDQNGHSRTATCAVTVTAAPAPPTPLPGEVFFDKSGNSSNTPQSFTLADNEPNFKYLLGSVNWEAGGYIELSFTTNVQTDGGKGLKLTIGEQNPPSGGACLEWFSSDSNCMRVYHDSWSNTGIVSFAFASSDIQVYHLSKDGLKYSRDNGTTWSALNTNAYDKIKDVTNLYYGLYGACNQTSHACTIHYLKVYPANE